MLGVLSKVKIVQVSTIYIFQMYLFRVEEKKKCAE